MLNLIPRLRSIENRYAILTNDDNMINPNTTILDCAASRKQSNSTANEDEHNKYKKMKNGANAQ